MKQHMKSIRQNHKNKFVVCLLISLIFLIIQPAAASDGQWIITGSLDSFHRVHTATLLPDGKVLVAGGCGDLSCTSVTASADIYDPDSGTWTATASMNYARSEHSAILLPNGKVLVAGGHIGSTVFDSAELFDPTLGTWTVINPMINARYGSTPILLNNGKVLFAGGINVSGFIPYSEIFDPSNGDWTATGSLNVARTSSAILLENGQVLLAGGQNSSFLTSAELYNPDTGTWSYTGSMNTVHAYHPLIQLSSGKILFPGAPSSPSCELYDPNTGTWVYTGSLNAVRRGASVALLPNGEVIAAGGSIFGGPGYINTAEIYNPFTEIWTNIAPMNNAIVWVPATLLQNGNLLIVMGTNAEYYYENYPPIANAGYDQSVDTFSTVSLDGSGSNDPNGDPLTYQWTQTSGTPMTLSDSEAVNPSFTAPGDPDTLIFSLVVTDNSGIISEPDEVVITVNNQAPVANAGEDQSVKKISIVTLDGSLSSDPDDDLPLTYQWTQIGGTSVTLSDPTAVNPTIKAPKKPDRLIFSLIVTDSRGMVSEPDEVVIIVSNRKNP